MLTNGMYDRLIISKSIIFNNSASNRWLYLRNNLLKESNLIHNISSEHNFLVRNGNYTRERLKWGQESIDLSILEYTYEWLNDRIEFLDTYFSFHILGINGNILTPELVNIYPNPVISKFKIMMLEKAELYYYVFNTSGTLLGQGFASNRDAINVEYLSRGIYFLKIRNDQTNLLAKIRFMKL